MATEPTQEQLLLATGTFPLTMLSIESAPPVTKASFEYIYAIGKGGFGKVWKVERRKDRMLFAMKEMSKARVLTKRSVNSVLNERKVLQSLQHK